MYKVELEEMNEGSIFFCSVSVALIHGDMHQEERNSVINAFKKQEVPVMVATDVAGMKNYVSCTFRGNDVFSQNAISQGKLKFTKLSLKDKLSFSSWSRHTSHKECC